MKVAHAEKHVLGTGGLGEVHAFTMRANAHAFKMLSSGMYSDKITAVLREIGCNAHDAHIAQGIGHKAFEVKLPNSLDNQFYIKDRGTGLGHNDVMNLYTTYFASTKQESNDYTGAFGLGSKSPFSYTDSFTVTSCYKGMKRIYTAHVGNEGIPVIALMGEGPVDKDWKTGIEVGFPVKPEDFRSFAEKAAKVFRFFNPLPDVVGSNVQIKPLIIEKDFGQYAFLDRGDDDFEYGMCVQMGNVKYPVDPNQLAANAGVIVEKAKGLKGLLLRFDLGKLQVTGSREELQYDPATKHALATRLGEVLIWIAKEVETAFKGADTWQKLVDFKALRDTVSRGLYLNKELFDLAGIKDNTRLVEACSKSHFTLPETGSTALAHYGVLHMEVHGGVNRMRIQRPSGVGGKNYIQFSSEPLCIVHGDDTNGQSRIRKAFVDSVLTGRVILVVPRKKLYGTKVDVDLLLSKMQATFKGVPAHDLSAYPAPPIFRVHRKKGAPPPPLPADEVTVRGDRIKICDVKDTVYVISRRRSTWGRSRMNWMIDDLTKLDRWGRDGVIQNIDEIKKEIPDISLVFPTELGAREVKRFGLLKRPEWKTFKEHVHEALVDPVNISKLKILVEDTRYIVDLNYHHGSSTGFLDNIVYLKEKKPDVFKTIEAVLDKHDILKEINHIHKESKKPNAKRKTGEPTCLEAYRSLAQRMNVKIDTPAFHKATQNLDDKFQEAASIDYDTLEAVIKHAPSVFPHFIDEVLKRG